MILEKKPTAATTSASGPTPGLKLCVTVHWAGENAQGQEAQLSCDVRPEPRFKVVQARGNDSLPHDVGRRQRIEDFLHTVYLLSDVENTRMAIDQVFDYFNGLLRAPRRLELCNGTLAAVDIEAINSTLMVAFLSITLPVKDELWARPGFFAAVKRKLVGERGEERASRLLDKYK